jgi:hypothetical protein
MLTRFLSHLYLFSFRFLTPAPLSNELPLNGVARQAGANPITLPNENANAALAIAGGENSPTGVSEFVLYPSWADGRDPPSWFAKGADVDALLDVSDTLDWLADPGDLNETYRHSSSLDICLETSKERLGDLGDAMNSTSVATLPHVESVGVVPPLPSLFGDTTSDLKELDQAPVSSLRMSISASSMDDHLHVFENPMEENDFVATILENSNESTVSLPALT